MLPLAALWALVTPLLSHVLRTDMPLASYDNPTGASFEAPGALLRELLLTGYYPGFPWTAYLLAGLGIGRLTLGHPRVATTLLAGGVAVAAAAWLGSWLVLEGGGLAHLAAAGLGGHPANRPFTDGILTTSFYGTSPATSWWWLTVASPHTATPFDLVHTIGTSAAVLGTMLLVARWLRPMALPLAAVGSMTLTLYSLHVILLSTVLPSTDDNAYLLHVVVAFAVAIPWRTLVGRGPLEAMTAAFVDRTRRLASAGDS